MYLIYDCLPKVINSSSGLKQCSLDRDLAGQEEQYLLSLFLCTVLLCTSEALPFLFLTNILIYLHLIKII